MFEIFFKGFDTSHAENCDNINELPDIYFVVKGTKGPFRLIL